MLSGWVAQGQEEQAGTVISREHAAYNKGRIPQLQSIMEEIYHVLGREGTGGQSMDLPDVADGVPNAFVAVKDFSGLRRFVEVAIASGEVQERDRTPLAPIYEIKNQVALLLDTKPFQDGTVKLYGKAGTYVTLVRELQPAPDGEEGEEGRKRSSKLYAGSYLTGLRVREEERESDAAKLAADEALSTDTLARMFADIKVGVEQSGRNPADFEVSTAYVEFGPEALPGGGLLCARVAEGMLALDYWRWVVNENANFVTLRGNTIGTLDPAKAAEMGALAPYHSAAAPAFAPALLRPPQRARPALSRAPTHPHFSPTRPRA